MGLRLINDTEDQLVCMYDSVTDWAFGPVFTSVAAVERFQRYAAVKHDVQDLRALSNPDLYRMWEQYCEQGGRRDDESV